MELLDALSIDKESFNNFDALKKTLFMVWGKEFSSHVRYRNNEELSKDMFLAKLEIYVRESDHSKRSKRQPGKLGRELITLPGKEEMS